VADLAKFKKILFNFDVYARQNKEVETQSEALMAMFDIPKNQMIEPNTFLDDRIIDSIQARFPKGGLETSIIVNNVLEYLRGKD